MVKLNKKAQTQIFFIFMMGIVFFILGMALAPAVSQVVSERTNTEELNCSLDNLTKVQQSVCTQLDIFSPFWLGICFGLAGLLLGAVAVN